MTTPSPIATHDPNDPTFRLVASFDLRKHAQSAEFNARFEIILADFRAQVAAQQAAKARARMKKYGVLPQAA